MAVERVKIVLDKVYNELSSVAVQLDNQIAFIKNIQRSHFSLPVRCCASMLF